LPLAQTGQVPLLDLSNFKLLARNLPEEIIAQISASNLYIKEIGGAIIYDRNFKEIKPIASLTKLMTALVAYKIYPEDEKFKISSQAVKIEGETGAFKTGETFSRNDLIKAALVGSSNDAAFALAEKAGLKKFIGLMNLTSKEIGMNDTRFFGPTGINNENKSSLRDLSLLVEYVLRNYPEILNFSKIQKFSLAGKHKREVENLNYLLPFYKGYIVGSKTGFTDEAGECLILVLKFEKSPFISLSLLNSKNRFEDAEKLILALKKLYQ
jgi:D-alanyl-D-alanine carboxypeptidase